MLKFSFVGSSEICKIMTSWLRIYLSKVPRSYFIKYTKWLRKVFLAGTIQVFPGIVSRKTSPFSGLWQSCPSTQFNNITAVPSKIPSSKKFTWMGAVMFPLGPPSSCKSSSTVLNIKLRQQPLVAID